MQNGDTVLDRPWFLTTRCLPEQFSRFLRAAWWAGFVEGVLELSAPSRFAGRVAGRPGFATARQADPQSAGLSIPFQFFLFNSRGMQGIVRA